MSHSLSDPTGSFPAPRWRENQPVDVSIERDQEVWYVGMTDEWYQSQYIAVWNRAYLATRSEGEADDIANRVFDAVWHYERPPSKAMIAGILREQATWRILDCLKSLRHRLLRMSQPLTQRSPEGEEFEVDLKSGGCLGADEELFRWEKDEATAQQIAQAVLRLNERQRTCFFLHFMEKMKTEEIAKLLKIPPATVSTECYRARNKVRRWLREWREKQENP